MDIEWANSIVPNMHVFRACMPLCKVILLCMLGACSCGMPRPQLLGGNVTADLFCNGGGDI